MSHRQRIFAFEFAALSFASPSQTRYRFRLQGLETAWNEVDSTQRLARCTAPAPKDYVFHVQSRIKGAPWNEKGVAIRIRILPAWWETWQFEAACVLAFGLMVWAAYFLRTGQIARQIRMRFEERLNERTRLAGELHDTLLQGFVSASMQLDVAADRLPPDSPVKPKLEKILGLMYSVSEEGRNALQGLTSGDGKSMQLERAFAQIGREFEGTGHEPPTELRVSVEGLSQPLHPVLRDEVDRVGREAIVNAFRHSGSPVIQVGIEYLAKEFRLTVRDDGRGVDQQLLKAGREGHMGLHLMRQRSERIGAQFRVRSRAGSGARVEMSVPGQVAYQLYRRYTTDLLPGSALRYLMRRLRPCGTTN